MYLRITQEWCYHIQSSLIRNFNSGHRRYKIKLTKQLFSEIIRYSRLSAIPFIAAQYTIYESEGYAHIRVGVSCLSRPSWPERRPRPQREQCSNRQSCRNLEAKHFFQCPYKTKYNVYVGNFD